MKKFQMMALLCGAFWGATLIGAPAEPAGPVNDQPPTVKKRPDGRERFRRGPGAWRVMAQMTENERQALMVLQRTDPEKFRAVMKEKTDALYLEEVARVKTLQALVDEYARQESPDEKKRIKDKISSMVKSDFHRRLAENRLQLENMKRRTANLERELDKRSAKADEIIAVQVEEILKGAPFRWFGGPPPRRHGEKKREVPPHHAELPPPPSN